MDPGRRNVVATSWSFKIPSVVRSLLCKEITVGLTVLEVEVGNPTNPEVTEKLEFLIDSGAIYSVVPTPILERLGIRPLVEQEFRLADGTKVVRKKGVALFKYGDRIGGADVIFGEEGDSMLLGAFTLEALGLSLDPLRRELKPLPMMLAVLQET
jgi:clan AA aspartic protease